MLAGLARRDQGEFFKWRAILHENEEEGKRLNPLLFEVFRELVVRRFANEPDLRAIFRFLQVPRLLVVPDKRLPVLEAEALIRAALGERGLVGGIGIALASEIRLQLLVYLVEDLMLSQGEIDGLIVDAERHTFPSRSEPM
jgi:hypothetical protein